MINNYINKGGIMNPQIQAIKERIKALRERNKQINTELENNATEVKKDTLNTEKEHNNNELRKERTHRYDIQKLCDEAVFMKECCEYLKQVGLIRSRHEFCRDFLKKTPNYLAIVICEGRKPTISTIHFLLQNLKEVCFAFNDDKNKSKMLNLINRGQELINKRLAMYL